MSGAALELHGVTRRYVSRPGQEQTALHNVSLSISPESVVGIAGPSGSGKSTLLHLIGAMDSPSEGNVVVGGVDLSSLAKSAQAEFRRSIGFVFQRFHLLPALTVIDNVAAPLLPYRAQFDKFERARELLAAVGLEDRADSLPSSLSGGQGQRVAIARALINDPGLLLADEPTGNLDSTTGAEILQLLLDLRDQRGMTVMVATHDPVIASRCDRIVRLEDGRVIDDVEVEPSRSPEELLGRISRLDPGR